MATATLTTDYKAAEGYLRMLNPLSEGIKLCLLKMITDSLVVKTVEYPRKKESSLSKLFGVWADSSDTDDIEDFIKSSRTNSAMRKIVSFD